MTYRYNELCAKGEDEDFGKLAEWMMPITADGSAKLVALQHHPMVCDTYGGIVTDLQQRVLTPEGEVIPGVYAAGATAFAKWFNTEYPGCGYAFGTSLYMGKTAAMDALTELGMPAVDVTKRN